MSDSATNPPPPSPWPRIAACSSAAAAAALVVLRLTVHQFPDPDMYHGMALGRLILESGRVPLEETFSYTPTIYPAVHHEWAYGVMMCLLATHAGAPGLLALRYALTAATAALGIACARRRGASWPMLAVLAPLTLHMAAIGLTTVRAQVFTMLFTALLLLLLESDRRGGRRWIALWLPAHALWVNIHAGFFVGLVFLGAHWLEQVVRERKAQWHLIATGLAAALMVPLVSPYGAAFVPAVWQGVTMDRWLVSEWHPLWRAEPHYLAVYALAVLLVVYASFRRGWRRLPSLLIVALTAYAALRHNRHLSLFALVFLAYVPAYLSATPLAETIDAAFARRPRAVAAAAAGLLAVAIAFMPRAPWCLEIPTMPDDERRGKPVLPVGVVDYLREVGFRGNIMPPFTAGAYLMWHLSPDLKVGQDGRYEAAYQPGVVEELRFLFRGEPGWTELLTKYPTDLLLAPRSRPIADLMPAAAGWTRVYRDESFDLYARPGLTLPAVDRSGEPIVGRFP